MSETVSEVLRAGEKIREINLLFRAMFEEMRQRPPGLNLILI